MASIPEQSVPSVMGERVVVGCAVLAGAVGRSGSPAHARRSFCCVATMMRCFFGGAGLMLKVGLCGSVVWRMVVIDSVVGVRGWRRLVTSLVIDTLGTPVVL